MIIIIIIIKWKGHVTNADCRRGRSHHEGVTSCLKDQEGAREGNRAAAVAWVGKGGVPWVRRAELGLQVTQSPLSRVAVVTRNAKGIFMQREESFLPSCSVTC